MNIEIRKAIKHKIKTNTCVCVFIRKISVKFFVQLESISNGQPTNLSFTQIFIYIILKTLLWLH